MAKVTILCTCGAKHSVQEWRSCPVAIHFAIKAQPDIYSGRIIWPVEDQTMLQRIMAWFRKDDGIKRKPPLRIYR